MPHPVLAPGKVAVITGAALGIGRAAARRFAALGMKVCLADLPSEDLNAAAFEVAGPDPERQGDVLAVAVDVSDPFAMQDLEGTVRASLGQTDLIMNNAVTRAGGDVFDDHDGWHKALDVNFWGVIHGVRAFLPGMLERGGPGMVINVGSKQGITNPPGNLAYNVTKAAVKTYTEGLQHHLRNAHVEQVTSRLLIPGFTTTGKRQHRPGAWLPDQVVDFMIPRLERGDFYILCPDDQVTAEMDRKRMQWAVGDISDRCQPLTRWDDAYKADFEKFMG